MAIVIEAFPTFLHRCVLTSLCYCVFTVVDRSIALFLSCDILSYCVLTFVASLASKRFHVLMPLGSCVIAI